MPQPDTTTPSSVISSVVTDIQERAVLGLVKYGVPLDRDDLSRAQWLQHAYEEALDLACYLRRLIDMEAENGKRK